MKISHEKPTIYEKLKEVFNVDWDKGITIAYGDTVYSKFPLPPDLKVHEQIHLDQQKALGVEEWWKQYIESREFRLSQETPAYKAQVDFIRKNVNDRNARFAMIDKLARDMSTLYGDMVTYSEAKELLK